MGRGGGKLHPAGGAVPGEAGLEQVYHLQVVREEGEELAAKAGGVYPFLTAFLSGRKLTPQEAEELKRLIDEKMGEG